MTTLIDVLYIEHVEIVEYLLARGEISFSNTLGSAVPKIVLLAAASQLEAEVCAHINNFYESVTDGHAEAVAFVNNKAVSRQYHTYFNWKEGNANQFFGLFGEDALVNFKTQCKTDPEFAAAVKAFCSLGNLRNQLVHGNYAAFVLEKTAEEVFDLYSQARSFVAAIPGLIDHRSSLSTSGEDAEDGQ